MRFIEPFVAISLLAGLLGSCGDDSTTEASEHVWSVRYEVSNEAGEDLIVGLSGPATTGSTSTDVVAPAGATVEMLSYEESLGSPPDVSNDLWCVSIRLASDQTLVGQLCPLVNEQWVLEQPSRYHARFLLVVTETDLQPMEDQCPRLSGVVFESETGQAIVGATVDYQDENRFSLETNSSGRYFFYLPTSPPRGVITVSGQGYRSVEHVLPVDVVGSSNGLYRLDFGLMMAEK